MNLFLVLVNDRLYSLLNSMHLSITLPFFMILQMVVRIVDSYTNTVFEIVH
jgi:hypothetical protein